MPSKSFSRADLVTVVVTILVLGTLVFGQAFDPQRELANRATCAANVRGLMQCLVVYAGDNSDYYPILSLPKSATTYDVTFKGATAGRDAEKAIVAMAKDPTFSNNPSAAIWTLVLQGMVSPKQFLCRSDLDATAVTAYTNEKGEVYNNFPSANNFSYSTAYPWAENNDKVVVANHWKNTMDSAVPIISDMAPYFGRTAENNPSPSPDNVNEDWVLSHVNSTNHQGDGQNVAFGDAHAEFVRTPACGEANDNIWGTLKQPNKPGGKEQPIAAGTLPHPATVGIQGTFDVVMVPTRDARGESEVNSSGTPYAETVDR